MLVELVQNDNQKVTVEIPELNDLPDVLFSGNRAFKKHPQTDEYVECSVHCLPSAITSGIDYLTAAIGLIRASEHLSLLLYDTETQQPMYDSLTWRLRCAIEARTLIKNRESAELEQLINDHYPSLEQGLS